MPTNPASSAVQGQSNQLWRNSGVSTISSKVLHPNKVDLICAWSVWDMTPKLLWVETKNRISNTNYFQGWWVYERRIKASSPYVASTLEDPILQRCWGSCAWPVCALLDQYLHVVSVGQLNTRPKPTAPDSQELLCNSKSCKHPLFVACRVSSSKSKVVPSNSFGFSQAWAAASDRQDAMDLSTHSLIVWVWGGGQQATADYQVRKTRLLHK